MEKAVHKRIKINSLLLICLFSLFAGIIIFLLQLGKVSIDYTVYEICVVWAVYISAPLLAIVVSYSVYHKEKTWIRRFSRYCFWIFFIIIFPVVFLIVFIDSVVVTALCSMIIFVVTTFAVMHLFVFGDAYGLKNNIIFMLLIIVGIALKRLHFPVAGTLFSTSTILFSTGCFMYGIRCLFLAESNKFLKNVALLSSCIVLISLLGFLFRTLRYPGWPFMLNIGQVLLVLVTISVLLLLPSAGYIDWQQIHKKILMRLIMPWTLVFLLFIIKILMPNADAFLWERGEGRRVTHGFNMVDYKIEPSDKVSR